MKDFFKRQDEARRNTVKLVALFVTALAGIILAIYVVVVLLLAWVGEQGDFLQPQIALIVAVKTLAVVGVGSLVKILSLRSGGHVVAESLGGEKLGRPAERLPEQRLLNVVEEMAIASGTPVPPVYILEEDGINAFAAGFTPDDAVIGVTRGCVERLNREELQGVIAHEFSHILNEDMRLNIRLMGLLYGILLVGMTGRLLIRSMVSSGTRRSRSGQGRVALLVVGLTLLTAGFVGVLCGRMIKAAISRQREFLADASAVQFTRNPEGIGGALRKIGGHASGARIEVEGAEHASHLFFGYALEKGLFSTGWFSTHPPLTERIKRIDPSFDGIFSTGERATDGEVGPEGVSRMHGGAKEPSTHSTSDDLGVVEKAGTVRTDHMEKRQSGQAVNDEDLRLSVNEPLGAVAVVYSLLLNEEDPKRQRQLRLLRYYEAESVVEETERMYPQVAQLERTDRLPLLDLAAPALRELSDDQQTRVAETVRALAEADDHLTVFEYALETIVRHRLEHLAQPSSRRVEFHRFKQVESDVVTLLSALSSAGNGSVEASRAAFREGLSEFSERSSVVELEPISLGPDTLHDALDRLAVTSPPLKKKVLAASARCILSDEVIEPEERELLRAVSIALDVPMPPSIEGAKSTATVPSES